MPPWAESARETVSDRSTVRKPPMGSFPHMLGGFTDAHRTELSPYRGPSFACYSNPIFSLLARNPLRRAKLEHGLAAERKRSSRRTLMRGRIKRDEGWQVSRRPLRSASGGRPSGRGLLPSRQLAQWHQPGIPAQDRAISLTLRGYALSGLGCSASAAQDRYPTARLSPHARART